VLEIPFTLSCGGACGTQVYWAEADGKEMEAQDCVIACPADEVGARTLTRWMGKDREQEIACGVIVHAVKPMTLPAALKALDIESFAGTTVQEIVLPDGLSLIDERAFAQCGALALITIPDTVSFIADNAFEGSDGVAILCGEGSYAATYAERMEIPCFAE